MSQATSLCTRLASSVLEIRSLYPSPDSAKTPAQAIAEKILEQQRTALQGPPNWLRVEMKEMDIAAFILKDVIVLSPWNLTQDQGMQGSSKTMVQGHWIEKETIRKIAILISKKPRVKLEAEITSLRRLSSCKWVPQLLDVTESQGTIVLFMELCAGGDLSMCIRAFFSPSLEIFSNKEISFILYQMLHALKNLHAMQLVHRDVKLENFFLRESLEILANPEKRTFALKLGDLGYTCEQGNPSVERRFGFTPIYCAPEVAHAYLVHCSITKEANNRMQEMLQADATKICREYLLSSHLEQHAQEQYKRAAHPASDMWAVGRCAQQIFLLAQLPYEKKTPFLAVNAQLTMPEARTSIEALSQRRCFTLPAAEEHLLSSAERLTRALLNPNPVTRWSASAALQSPFITEELRDNPVLQRALEQGMASLYEICEDLGLLASQHDSSDRFVTSNVFTPLWIQYTSRVQALWEEAKIGSCANW